MDVDQPSTLARCGLRPRRIDIHALPLPNRRSEKSEGVMGELQREVDPARLRVALAQANIPALVLVLHQLTGERRWLEPPYRPSRGRGMDDNADGGLPAEVQ